MLKTITTLTILFFFFSIGISQDIEVLVLGVAQDGGYPHSGCEKSCCQTAFNNPDSRRHVASIGIIDHQSQKYWIIDCTPDFRYQLKMINDFTGFTKRQPSGIFLTHAHVGHYLGLAQLGKEVMGTQNMPVYAMPKMKSYLESNGPWDQLVNLNNIQLNGMSADQSVKLNARISVTPFKVPHRDEYSETVGFLIKTANESLMYIPDIDKWQKWNKDLKEEVMKVDYALIDGTFYDGKELTHRDISEVPHPSVKESMEYLSKLSPLERSKVHFIHLNHTNPLLDKKSLEYKSVFLKGYNVASEGLSIYLN